jgi:hypothetical protein
VELRLALIVRHVAQRVEQLFEIRWSVASSPE